MKVYQAFTLIEILVVIAILSGLITLVFPNFMEIRLRARDTQRKSDLKSIQKALELYKEAHIPPVYPTALPDPCSTFTLSNGSILLQKTPGDPRGTCNASKKYYYKVNATDTLRYDLYACLENSTDIEGIATGPADFTSMVIYSCTTNKYLKVTEP